MEVTAAFTEVRADNSTYPRRYFVYGGDVQING